MIKHHELGNGDQELDSSEFSCKFQYSTDVVFDLSSNFEFIIDAFIFRRSFWIELIYLFTLPF